MSWSKLHADAMRFSDHAAALAKHRMTRNFAKARYAQAADKEAEALAWLIANEPSKTRTIRITRKSLEALQAKAREE